MSNNDQVPLTPLQKALGASLSKPIDPDSEFAQLSKESAQARLDLNAAIRATIEGHVEETAVEKK